MQTLTWRCCKKGQGMTKVSASYPKDHESLSKCPWLGYSSLEHSGGLTSCLTNQLIDRLQLAWLEWHGFSMPKNHSTYFLNVQLKLYVNLAGALSVSAAVFYKQLRLRPCSFSHIPWWTTTYSKCMSRVFFFFTLLHNSSTLSKHLSPIQLTHTYCLVLTKHQLLALK